MTVAGQYFGAVLATIRRDAAIFATYRLRIVTQVMTTMFTLTMFYYIAKLVRPDAVGGRGHYYAFVVVGTAIISVLTAALTTSNIVRMELVQGNFERVVVSPLGPVGGVVALAAFPILYSIASAALMLGLAAADLRCAVSRAGDSARVVRRGGGRTRAVQHRLLLHGWPIGV